jgi:hypothetical protein
MEARLADPPSTLEGECWIRPDLAPEPDQLGTLRVDVGNSTLDVPIFAGGTSSADIEESLRIQLNNDVGYVPLAPLQDATYPELRVQQSSGTYGMHDAVEVSAIPDSVVEQWNAQTGFTASDEGTTISTWPGELGNYDLTGGSPVVQANAINGYRAPYFDGTDDVLDNTNLSVTQRVVVYLVINADFGDSEGTTRYIQRDPNDSPQMYWSGRNKAYSLYAGNSLAGPGDASLSLLTYDVNGGNSVIRADGTEYASGDAGTTDFDGVGLSNSGGHWLGHIGFAEVHDGVPSNGLQTREQEVADMWGITL